MLAQKYLGYTEEGLLSFAEKLQSEYYDAALIACANTRKQIDKIRKMEGSAQLQYLAQCEDIISQVEKHIKNRKDIYIPYLESLSRKVAENHNCSTCSGGCKVNHDAHILEMNMTNDDMKKVLSRLQVSTLPLYTQSMFPDEYRLLRSRMTLLETNLAELFFLENNYLIPKIAEAQRTINAGSK